MAGPHDSTGLLLCVQNPASAKSRRGCIPKKVANLRTAVGGTYMKREVKTLPTRERAFLFDFSRGAPVSMTASPAPRGRRDRRAVENGPLGSSSEIARRSPPAGRTGAERGSSELHRRDRRLFRIFRLTGQSKSVAQAPMRDSPKEVHEDRRA